MKSKVAKGYMCQIDFDFHVEEDINGVEIYPTIESLEKHHPCVKECGLVEVEIKLSKVIEEGTI